MAARRLVRHPRRPRGRHRAGRHGIRHGRPAPTAPAVRGRDGHGPRPERRAAAATGLDASAPEVADVPLLARCSSTGARMARAPGTPRRGWGCVRAGQDVPGLPHRARLPLLLGLCDVLVDRADYADLESPAADLVAAATGGATRRSSPSASDSSASPTSRRTVRSRRPSCSRRPCRCCATTPRARRAGRLGPGERAGGSLGQWPGARTAFVVAAAAFEADGGSTRPPTPSGGRAPPPGTRKT